MPSFDSRWTRFSHSGRRFHRRSDLGPWSMTVTFAGPGIQLLQPRRALWAIRSSPMPAWSTHSLRNQPNAILFLFNAPNVGCQFSRSAPRDLKAKVLVLRP